MTGSYNRARNHTLLVVDDELGHKKIRRQFQQIQKELGCGHEICIARSGDEAVALVRRLGDQGKNVTAGFINMRVLGQRDGLTTLRRIRAIDPGALFVLFVADVRDQILEQVGDLFRDAPDDWDFLRAPCSGEEIRQKARRVLAASERRRDMQRLMKHQHILEARLDRLTLEMREKMATMAASVAHRINNPIAFIQSNLGSLARYTEKIARFAAYVASGEEIFARRQDAEAQAFFREMQALRTELKLDFVLEDLGPLIQQSLSGTARVKRIVRDLRR